MFIDSRPATVCAPAERNVLVDDYVEPYISLRWSEERYRSRSINIRSLRDSTM